VEATQFQRQQSLTSVHFKFYTNRYKFYYEIYENVLLGDHLKQMVELDFREVHTHSRPAMKAPNSNGGD